MKLASIPERMEDWNTPVLNELIQLRDIESETFDFKTVVEGNNPVPSDLYQDICAMANTDGGYLVLGIEEIRDNGKVVGFRKVGFDKGNEDMVGRAVNENRLRIEPTPKMDMANIPEGDKFYSILKVWSEDFEKPFFVKERGQCYVRVGSSTKPAIRSTILKLFSNLNRRRADVENLRVTTILLRESFMHFIEEAGYAHPDLSNKITPIDLTFIKSAIVSSEWFLTKNELMGKIERNGSRQGITTVMHLMERLNTYAIAYNRESSKDEKRSLLDFLHQWKYGYSDFERQMEFLNKLEKATNEFLEEYRP